MRSDHTITVENNDGDFVEVEVTVDIYEEESTHEHPSYSECLLVSWKSAQYCDWLTEDMVDAEVQSLFEDHKI